MGIHFFPVFLIWFSSAACTNYWKAYYSCNRSFWVNYFAFIRACIPLHISPTHFSLTWWMLMLYTLLSEKIQWVQCDDCLKWRKVPANALLPSRWTCSENVWGLDRYPNFYTCILILKFYLSLHIFNQCACGLQTPNLAPDVGPFPDVFLYPFPLLKWVITVIAFFSRLVWFIG